MPVTTRFVAFALWACCLSALPSHANDSPQAHLEGFRCELLRDDAATPGTSDRVLFVCQIGEDGEPFAMRIAWPTQPTTTTTPLDALLDLLSTLDRALHNASLPQHDAVVPPPTP